jgi:Abnormal spindle-like microcephaly-assoc'd, ASPM-SPD-2-Hydin/PQQ-like domain
MHPRGYRVRLSARRLLLAMTGLALTLGALPALTGAMPGTAAIAARADDVTASQGLMRNGWDSAEPNMGPSVVPTFTQLFDTPVSGQVYAQPLVVGSTVVVATENDWVYGLDAATGAVSWSTHIGTAWNITKSPVPKLANCGDLAPMVGVTGTPVYDPTSGHVYFFANALNANGNPRFYLFGIDPTNGNVTAKILIWGHPSNDASLTFNPQYQGQRTGALLLNGWVYGAFASHCDKQPYAGYVAGVNLASSAFTLWTDESGVTYNQGGIWQSGGGLMSDGPGRIFFTSGNGVSPSVRAGSSPGGQLAESVVQLGVSASGTLAAKDFFSPGNAPTLDAADTDFGAGGPVGLPFGTATFPNVLAQGGKDGRIFLLNRSALGGRKQGPGQSNSDLAVTPAFGRLWEHPAVFGDTTLTQANAGSSPTDNDFLVSVGKNDVMRIFRFGDNAADRPQLSDVGASSLTNPYTSGSPVITSNGDDPSSAVIWEVHAGGESGAGSELDAYAFGSLISTGGTPSPCTSSSQCIISPIWHMTIPEDATKFAIPATSNGRVYLGTRGDNTTGQVIGYGVAPPSAPPVQAATTTLPQTSVSATTSKDVSITAKNPVTITGVAASTGASNSLAPASQFAVGQLTETPAGGASAQPVTLPVKLAKGAKLHALVKFSPAAPGTADGTVSFTTSTGRVRRVPVTGTGARPGLYAVPGTLAFPFAPDQGLTDVPVGVSVGQLVDVINGGSTTDRVTSVIPPASPFTATNLPSVGQRIKPGQALVVSFTYAPQQPGPSTGSFTITDSTGKRLTIPLSGSATASVSQVTAADSTVDFGPVPVGQTATKTVHVTNAGNVPATVSVPAVPKAPFHSRFHVFAGLPFNPGYSLTIPVTFTPARAGTFTTPYVFHWQDRTGSHSLTVTLTGTGVPAGSGATASPVGSGSASPSAPASPSASPSSG